MVISSDPNHKFACDNLGNALKHLGRTEEAIKFYDRAIAIDPQFKDAINNKGAALKDLGHFEGAIKL